MAESGKKFKLTYLNQQLLVVTKLTTVDLSSGSPAAFADLVARAEKKLAAEQAAKHIVGYFVEKGALNRAWPLLTDMMKGAPQAAEYGVAFGFGVREHSGLSVATAEQPDWLCRLSITAPAAAIKAWSVRGVVLFIRHLCQQQGIAGGQPDPQQIRELLSLVMKGGTVQQVPLMRGGPLAPMIIPPEKLPGAGAAANAAAPAAKAAVTAVQKPASPAAAPGQAAAKAGAAGAAVPATSANASAAPVNLLDQVEMVATYPGRGLLLLEISADKMKAAIGRFDVAAFSDKNLTLDETWLKRELKRQNIFLIDEDPLRRVTDAIKRQRDIKGLVVATGQEGAPGGDPALRAFAAATTGKGAGPQTEVKSSGRKTRVLPLCRTGDQVAEVYYRRASLPGLDVFGKPTSPPASEKYEVEVGDGATRVDAMRFTAKREGLLVIDGNKLDVVQAYSHQGDVNLTSGDIEFRGRVVIIGDVDTGARVTASGDVEVQGSVRGGSIYCRGALVVTGGINTGPGASIHARGGITADFIETSQIYCAGDLAAKTAVLSSRVFCGGKLALASASGRLAGGEIYAWDKIATTNLGFPTGAVTTVHMGVHWREGLRISLLTARSAHFEAMLEKEKIEIRELARLTPAQLTAKKAETKAKLRDRLPRWRGLIERVTERLKTAKATAKFNTQSTVEIRGDMAGDILFWINGKEVKGDPTLRSVKVKTAMSNNSYFAALDETKVAGGDGAAAATAQATGAGNVATAAKIAAVSVSKVPISAAPEERAPATVPSVVQAPAAAAPTSLPTGKTPKAS